MTMTLRHKAVWMTLLLVPAFASAQSEPWTREDGQREMARRDVVYERMARYGINREDVKLLGGGMHVDTREKITPYHTYDMILADRVLNPGEHYRFELDEYTLTMLIPDLQQSNMWIVPYVDTRTEPQREAVLRRSKSGLQVANLLWHIGTGIYPFYIGWDGRMALTISYRYLKPEEQDNFSSPEKHRDLSSRIAKSMVPSQAEVDDAKRNRMFFSRAGNRVYLDAETVVINGRVWIRRALNDSDSRRYSYSTTLTPDRMLGIGISLSQYDFNGNPDASAYPAALKRAIAQMEAMMGSLRIAKRDDDGAPDPFVIERVEPAPLPVREKLPE